MTVVAFLTFAVSAVAGLVVVGDRAVDALGPYLETVTPDIHELLKDYGVLDVAHKVVGVGRHPRLRRTAAGQPRGRPSVPADQGGLFLQIEEALPSVVREPALRDRRHLGEQVVDGQRRIQSVSDPSSAGPRWGHGRFDRGIVRFARRYADQVERDHAALVKAVRRGAMPSESGNR